MLFQLLDIYVLLVNIYVYYNLMTVVFYEYD